MDISLDIFVYLKNTWDILRKPNLEISVDISNICDIHRYLVIYLECIQSQMFFNGGTKTDAAVPEAETSSAERFHEEHELSCVLPVRPLLLLIPLISFRSLACAWPEELSAIWGIVEFPDRFFEFWNFSRLLLQILIRVVYLVYQCNNLDHNGFVLLLEIIQ